MTWGARLPGIHMAVYDTYIYNYQIYSNSVDRGGTGIVSSHPCPLQDIKSILPLVKKHARRTVLNSDTQEVMEHTKVLHSKLLLQGHNDALKQELTGSCENNIIHIEVQIGSLRPMAVDEQRSV